MNRNDNKPAAEQEPIGYRWRHSASEAWQYSNFPCGWDHQPLYAAPVAAPVDEMDTGDLIKDPLYLALDALYQRGWDDLHQGRKYDPRGAKEWQSVLDLFRAGRVLASTPAAPGIDAARIRALCDLVESAYYDTGEFKAAVEEAREVRSLIDASPKGGCNWPDCGHDTNGTGYNPGCTGIGCHKGGNGTAAGLLSAAKDFYNGTVADPAVRISCSTKERRDRVKALGEMLRDELKAAQASPKGGSADALDAARYRWLRDRYDPSVHDDDGDSIMARAGEKLDAAIDAELQATSAEVGA